MIAQVIINYQSKQTDKLYDYLIPEDMSVSVGSRVVVPFGRGAKQLEGFIFYINQSSKAKSLKMILSVTDDKPVFDEKMVELIEFMRNQYLCSYLDIVHAVIPAGVCAKREEWIVLLTQQVSPVSGIKEKILKLLTDNNCEMEYNKLSNLFDNSISAQINDLNDSGILKREYRESFSVNDKTIRMAKLSVRREMAEEYIQKMQTKAKIQCKALEILLYNESIAVSDLVQLSGGTDYAVRTLVKRDMITIYDMEVFRDPTFGKIYEKSIPPILTDEQENALKQLKTTNEKPFLLHGVTGSGKTEVYMRVIDEVVSKGKSAIMLVPEISLTPQTVKRFKERFDGRVAVFHSALSLGEKYDEWKKMRDGLVDIVIGARSAIFAPFKNIGIIIMDEEHEQTYKSEMSPRYHTREVAEFRAKQHGASLLLASATPSVESYYKTKCGEYTLLEMKKRAGLGQMPAVKIIDMRQELEEGNRSIFSRQLKSEIEKNLECREQTILFLNRRGFSTFVSCRECGFVAECPNCNISLTYHRHGDLLKCHYCGHTVQNYKICPKCSSKYIRYFGGGTQKVEEEIHNLFPDATTLRMDVDTTSGKSGHEKILQEFSNKQIDILIGTQMVTKGLDFPNVTLVGVISADTMLHMDDFRSSEKTYSMLEQVTGRAGRAEKTGRAIIQTYSPEHEAVIQAKQHNYTGFYEREISMRHAMWYPPMCDIAGVIITGTQEHLTKQAAHFFARHLVKLDESCGKVQVLGPIPATISKIKNRYRYRILIKCEDCNKINTTLTDAASACYNNKNYRNIAIVIDKNPNQTY